MEKDGQSCEEVNRANSNDDNFKDVFKYYKRKQPPPDLSGVLEVNDMEEAVDIIKLSNISEKDETIAEQDGLKPLSTWSVYTLHQHPGLLIIRNPFTSSGQLMWMMRCLQEYPCAQNPSNLTSHGINLSNQTWWQLTQTSEGKKKGLSKKLRWVTLGYHHNWDTKEYSEDMKGVMPDSLVMLCTIVSKALGFPHFKAEAAIVNYYHMDSTLAAHTDHSEPCITAPLFSFSFGQSAVFLIGGKTKTVQPTALYLHSGDVLVMSGSSRLTYHAVPKIIEAREQPWEEAMNVIGDFNRLGESESMSDVKKEHEDLKSRERTNNQILSGDCDNFSHNLKSIVSDYSGNDCQAILDYIKFSRINLNVRQVLESSTDKLPR